MKQIQLRRPIKRNSFLAKARRLLVAGLVLASCSNPYSTEPISGSHARHDATQWPSTTHHISSPFGPRLKASEGNRYDFHRGIDINQERGSPISSIADGAVFATYRENQADNPYPNGGNVVVVWHQADKPIAFHSKEVEQYYSVYMHLETINVNGGQKVSKSDIVGTAGTSGTTESSHLHFEIRLGTPCSIEYQITEKGNHCQTVFDKHIDPHVNPLLILDYPQNGSMTVEVVNESPLEIEVVFDSEIPDFNRMDVFYGNSVKTLDLNLRKGINPYDIDNQFFDGLKIFPDAFSSKSPEYRITFKLPYLDHFSSIEVLDIWGSGLRITKN